MHPREILYFVLVYMPNADAGEDDVRTQYVHVKRKKKSEVGAGALVGLFTYLQLFVERPWHFVFRRH